jgi:hypothetical protein
VNIKIIYYKKGEKQMVDEFIETTKKKFYVYTEEDFGKGTDRIHIFRSILPFELTLTYPKGGEENAIKEVFTREKMLELHRKCRAGHVFKGIDIVERIKKIEPVYIKKRSKFYPGTYYAHEYDTYAPGKIRRIEYSNGFVEYEVKCLYEKLKVADGIFSEEDHYRDRYENGSGDYFESTQIMPWEKKEK